MEAVTGEKVSLREIVLLSAKDSIFYAKTFFPKTVGQAPAEFHPEMYEALDDPRNRYVSFEVFRGGAKTTILRLFISKRVAFGISHTIIVVGKSQEHAIKSLHWLKVQVEYNRKWAQTFGLSKGEKWADAEIEIKHGTDQYPIRVLALGITGSVRGINIDDHRPDLIVLDDPCDEENTATVEQRQKIEALTYGALMKSLAPRSEAPDATMVLAQTPLDPDDLVEQTMDDPMWRSIKYSCFNARGESRWPERWSTEELLKEKMAHIQKNRLSLWLREMECTLITQENAAFRRDWLEFYDILPPQGLVYMGIDPTPPPRDGNKLKAVNSKLDDAVIIVVMLFEGKVYVCDYYITKSPDPEEFINMFFSLALQWRPMLVGIETTLFQRMLKWYLEKEMLARRQFFTLVPVEDRRKKETRIIQGVTRYASNGALVVHRDQKEFIEQYERFQAQATGQRDDILDALTIALDLINPGLEGATIEGDFIQLEDDSSYPDLEEWRTAP